MAFLRTRRRRLLLGGGLLLAIVGPVLGAAWHLGVLRSPPARYSLVETPLDCAGADARDGGCVLLRLSRCDTLTVYALDPDAPDPSRRGTGDGTIGLGNLGPVARPPSPAPSPAPPAPPPSLFATGVLAHRDLSGADADALLSSWRTQVLGPSFTLCSMPYYGLRCTVADQVQAEWKLCFACADVTFSLPSSSGPERRVFDARTPQAQTLRQILERALPHPSAPIFRQVHRHLELE